MLAAAAPQGANTPATVLLVDDEAPIRDSLGPYLERSGYRVLLASDGVEALDLLDAYLVDIVVTDVLMPRMDGRELVRRLRAGGTWTPVIMLTQLDASCERVSALDDGADDYLSKPFDPGELASRILTPKAVTLLDYLMSHPGELHTRDALLSALWGIDFSSSTRAVDHRVRELRRALGDDASEPTYIETVPSVGYRFRVKVHA